MTEMNVRGGAYRELWRHLGSNMLFESQEFLKLGELITAQHYPSGFTSKFQLTKNGDPDARLGILSSILYRPLSSSIEVFTRSYI